MLVVIIAAVLWVQDLGWWSIELVLHDFTC